MKRYIKPNRLLLFTAVLFAITSVNSYGKTYEYWSQMATNGNITLSEMMDNDNFDWNYRIWIRQGKDNLQGKRIREIETASKMGEDLGYKEAVWSSICLDAFTTWCNIFLHEKKDYVVFSLPWNFASAYNPMLPEELLSSDNNKSDENLLRNLTNVQIDPHINECPLNQILDEKKVVLLVQSKCLYNTRYIVYITAIMPYKNKYYRCGISYCFAYHADPKEFKTTDINEICEQTAKNIEYFPDRYLSAGCYLDGPSPYNYVWTFKRTGDISIERIPLNTKDGPVTVTDIMNIPVSERNVLN